MSWDTKGYGAYSYATKCFKRPSISIIPIVLYTNFSFLPSPPSWEMFDVDLKTWWKKKKKVQNFIFSTIRFQMLRTCLQCSVFFLCVCFSFFSLFLRTKLWTQNSKFSVRTLKCVCRACLWHIVLNIPIYAFPCEKPLPVRNWTKSPVITISVTSLCVRLNLNSVYVLYPCTYVHIQKAIYIQYMKHLCRWN